MSTLVNEGDFQPNPRRMFLKRAAALGGTALALSQLRLEGRAAKPVPDNHPKHNYSASSSLEIKTFPNLLTVKGMSQNQLNQHIKLYQGYVTKTNEIQDKLAVFHAEQATLSSDFRALHVEQTYALNGAILHEYYFENIGGETVPLEKTAMLHALLLKEFSSIENYFNHLKMLGKISRGWAITAYNMRDHRIHNYSLDLHNQGVPMGVIPILVLDVYEHAYMIDFETNRASYLDAFMANVNWSVVDQRLKTMILHAG
jgi:superoxide dismutase, Fe-Mn family